jgi:peptidyl-prolyl cis-trans isomerase B (cyclophilin B)
MNKLSNLFFLCIVVGFLASCSRPVANFVYDQAEDIAPSEVKFKNDSKNATTYSWDFGDGKSSNEESPAHQYLQSGNYEVTLIAKNEKGKENSFKTRMMVKPPKKCLVQINTPYGDMLVELYDETPKHRDNFFKLAEEGFYNDLIFHRVIEGFMIQGGDPQSKDAKPGQPLGSGGPGYQIPAEFNSDFVHVKGALAAARQGDQTNPDRKSSGSQFYIVQGKTMTDKEIESMERRSGLTYTSQQKEEYMTLGGTAFLDGQYTVFGRVISGLEVIDKIAAVKKAAGDRPAEDIKMTMETIK